jgi:hypothetical protein
VGKRHGAYSEQEIAPLQEAIFEQLREHAPVQSEADDHARRVLAGRLAQIKIAQRWIAEKGLINERGELWPIVRELTKWEGSAQRLMRELGLTTLSRTELGLGLAQTHVAMADVARLTSEYVEIIRVVVSLDAPAEKRQEVALRMLDEFGWARELPAGEGDA